jgi:PhnB protein
MRAFTHAPLPSLNHPQPPFLMAKVSTYLNFARTTEEAFLFYKSVFKTEFATPVMRFGDNPPCPDTPPMAEADKKLVMHVCLPLLGDHLLMGSDCPESMGRKLTIGNNFYINLEPDTRAESDKLFAALSAGGKVDMPLQDMFWGAYWGCLVDKFGIQWMFNCTEKK